MIEKDTQQTYLNVNKITNDFSMPNCTLQSLQLIAVPRRKIIPLEEMDALNIKIMVDYISPNAIFNSSYQDIFSSYRSYKVWYGVHSHLLWLEMKHITIFSKMKKTSAMWPLCQKNGPKRHAKIAKPGKLTLRWAIWTFLPKCYLSLLKYYVLRTFTPAVLSALHVQLHLR